MSGSLGTGVDSFSIHKRLAELKKEIEEIYREDLTYKRNGHCRSPHDIPAHDQRMIRMKLILEEIKRLTKKPTLVT
jgi:hypothetical protein